MSNNVVKQSGGVTNQNKGNGSSSTSSNTSEEGGTSKYVDKGLEDTKLARTASEEKKSAKQARRNARHLEKKGAEAASGV